MSAPAAAYRSAIRISNRAITSSSRPQTIRRTLRLLPHQTDTVCCCNHTRSLSTSTPKLLRPPTHSPTYVSDGSSPSSILKPVQKAKTADTARAAESTTSETAAAATEQEGDGGSLKQKLADTVTKMMPSSTMATYQAYVLTGELYRECKIQADYVEGEPHSDKAAFWYQDCGLPETFNTWVQITTLHMWTIMVRLRTLEREHASIWQQHFVNHFFYDMENIMVEKYKITAASQRTKYLKEINEQFRGSIGAYDEALLKGDATLATALWRNIWDASDEVDFEKLALVVGFVRRVMVGLEKLGDAELLKAKVSFGSPSGEAGKLKKFVKPLEED